MAPFTMWFFFSIMAFQFHGYSAQSLISVDSSVALPKCSSVRTSIEKSVSNFEISGTWFSKRCEVRPGPQYVLRSYVFRYDGKFVLNHRFYRDCGCSIPLHTVTSYGKIRLNSIRRSFRVGGAKDVSYSLRKVKVKAHTKKGGKHFRKLLMTKCPFCLEQYYKSKTVSSYPVYYSTNNCDCLEAMEFYLGELEIMRVVQRERYERSKGFDTELYVGSVKRLSAQKRYYRSSTYQDPMVKEKKNSSICDVCTKIGLSTNRNLPRLQKQKTYNVTGLNGNWMSVRCEVRPGSLFVTRHLTLFSGDNVWLGNYRFFFDSDCSKPKYSLKAFGRYLIEKPSSIVAGAFDAQFFINHLFVTSYSDKITQQFNFYREGRSKEIVTNEEINVTNEGGLDAIQLYLPNKEYELLKITKEKDNFFLFTGRRPGIGNYPDEVRKRATSFQDELVLCQNNVTCSVSSLLYGLYSNNSWSHPSDNQAASDETSCGKSPEALFTRQSNSETVHGAGGTCQIHQSRLIVFSLAFFAWKIYS